MGLISVYPSIIPWFLMCLFAPAHLVLTIFPWSPPQRGASPFTQLPQPEAHRHGEFPLHCLHSLGHLALSCHLVTPGPCSLFPIFATPACVQAHILFLGLSVYCINLPISDEVILIFLMAPHCLQNKFLSSCVSLSKTGKFSKPEISHLQNGDHNGGFVGSLREVR